MIQWIPLAKTLAGQVVADPGLIPDIFKHVGPVPLLDWLRHFVALGTYSALNTVAAPVVRQVGERLPPKEQYKVKRTLEAWEYGSGGDYRL